MLFRSGVHRVAGWWKVGLNVEQIAERLSSLTPAEIHVALAYYHLHKEEIDEYLEEERARSRAANPPVPAEMRLAGSSTWMKTPTPMPC